MKYILLLSLIFLSCNPLKHAESIINQSDEAKNKIGEQWVKDHPCVNDTIIKTHSDTLTTIQTETKYLPGTTNTVTNTRIDTLRLTTIKTNTIHDTVTNTIVDERALNASQSELEAYKSDCITQQAITQNDLNNAKHTASVRLWWLIGMGTVIAGGIGIKIYNAFNPAKKILSI